MGVTLGYHRLREFRWNDLHFFLRQKLLGDNIIAYNYRHRCQLDEQTDSTRLSAVSLCYAVVGQLSSAPARSNVVYRVVTKALSSMGRRQAGQPGEIQRTLHVYCLSMHGMSGEKAIISNLISGMAGRTWKLCEMLCNLSMLRDRPAKRFARRHRSACY